MSKWRSSIRQWLDTPTQEQQISISPAWEKNNGSEYVFPLSLSRRNNTGLSLGTETYDLELSFEGPALSHACSRSGTWRCPFRPSNHVQQISDPLVGCFLSGQGLVARLRVDRRGIQRCGVRRYRDLTAGYSLEGTRMTALENEWNQEKKKS